MSLRQVLINFRWYSFVFRLPLTVSCHTNWYCINSVLDSFEMCGWGKKVKYAVFPSDFKSTLRFQKNMCAFFNTHDILKQKQTILSIGRKLIHIYIYIRRLPIITSTNFKVRFVELKLLWFALMLRFLNINHSYVYLNFSFKTPYSSFWLLQYIWFRTKLYSPTFWYFYLNILALLMRSSC